MKPNKLVLATQNKNKVSEIQSVLNDINIEIVPVKDDFSPIESGKTFYENSYVKAFEAAKLMNMPAMADDTGLVIDALNGRPGIHSARYAKTPQKRIEKVLTELKNTPKEKRTAKFVCYIVIVMPNGEVLFSTEGVCEGYITETLKGDNGFGYDPIFYIPVVNKTMAELTLQEKNTLSHRGKALAKLVKWLED